MSDYRHRIEAFSRVTRPPDDQVRRVASRLRQPAPRESRVLPALTGAALGLATVAAFVAWREAGPEPIAMILPDVPAIVEPAPGVVLDVDGTGRASGTTRDVLLTWEAGTLGVEVQPDAGIALQVATPEGAARVVGTGFDVLRDAFGTTVTVRHGQVEVTCAEQAPILLVAGHSRSCLPITAAGLLGRARAQQRDGSSPDVVLATLDLGLARAPSPQVRDELRVARIDVLVRASRHGDALREAEAYLADGGVVRRDEIERLSRELGGAQ
jgi:hypothetical protein